MTLQMAYVLVCGLLLGSLGGLLVLALYGADGLRSLADELDLQGRRAKRSPAPSKPILELAQLSLASPDRCDRAGAARRRRVTLGRLEEIELLTGCGNGYGHPVRMGASVELATDGHKLLIGCSRIGLRSRIRAGWRPWRRRVGLVSAVAYRTMRWAGGLMDRKGAALAQRWGPPAYRHEFAGSAWLVCGVTGRLWIEGSFALEPLPIGGWGMIRG